MSPPISMDMVLLSRIEQKIHKEQITRYFELHPRTRIFFSHNLISDNWCNFNSTYAVGMLFKINNSNFVVQLSHLVQHSIYTQGCYLDPPLLLIFSYHYNFRQFATRAYIILYSLTLPHVDRQPHYRHFLTYTCYHMFGNDHQSMYYVTTPMLPSTTAHVNYFYAT